MKKILACAGINGSRTALEKLLEVARERKPSGILFAGGICDPAAATPEKVAFMTWFFEALGKTGRRTIIIPGPHDALLWEFLRAALTAEIVFPCISVAHATLISRGEVAASGIGGAITESEDISNPTIKYSHASVEYFLRTMLQVTKPIKILLLSEVPTGKLGGSGGNRLVREFIQTYHPTICVVGGKKEYRGWEEERHSIVVNPGWLAEGSAAWVERVERKVEMLDL